MASTPGTLITPNAIKGQPGVAGDGGILTVGGGNGDGGTAAGGSVDIVPGTAVSTGAPGEVLVNSVAGLQTLMAYSAALPTTAFPANAVTSTFFIATRACRVRAVKMVVVTHGTSEAINITKETGTQAAGGGTTILTANVATATANTVVSGSLSTTVATITLAAGDRLSWTSAGTIGAAAGLNLSVGISPC